MNLHQQQNQSIKNIEIENIGPVSIQKNRRSKKLRITIKAGKPVKVTIPFRLSFSDGENFVRSKISWITKHLSTINSLKAKQTLFNESTNFKTRSRSYKFLYSGEERLKIRVTKDHILVECPNNTDINNHEAQNLIKKGIIEAMRFEAKETLPLIVDQLAKEFGFKYRKITIKNARTRWGSCSSNNNINLNLHLIRLPDELIKHVILHELVHTQHKNHGKNFWKRFEEIENNLKEKIVALKQYSIDIF
jgi:predicted metal-dependent hydrolase